MNLRTQKVGETLLYSVMHNSLTYLAKSLRLNGGKDCKCDVQLEREALQVSLYLNMCSICAQYVALCDVSGVNPITHSHSNSQQQVAIGS